VNSKRDELSQKARRTAHAAKGSGAIEPSSLTAKAMA
jgi:hypothetical protein